jgi:hypothetical protein
MAATHERAASPKELASEVRALRIELPPACASIRKTPRDSGRFWSPYSQRASRNCQLTGHTGSSLPQAGSSQNRSSTVPKCLPLKRVASMRGPEPFCRLREVHAINMPFFTLIGNTWQSNFPNHAVRIPEHTRHGRACACAEVTTFPTSRGPLPGSTVAPKMSPPTRWLVCKASSSAWGKRSQCEGNRI